MASISKPFVATAIMQLVEQGKIDLNAPLIQYLPYFQLADDRYKTITIQQMLCHMSGMPDVEDYEWEKPQYDEGALERYVRSLTGHSLKSEPGEKYAYSNMAFECLGDVIAKVSGISFADYVKKRILDPSGMKESSFHKPKDLPENWAAPHLRVFETSVWDGYPYNRMHGPSSTLHSNILEMCNWAMINIHRGTYNNQKILNASSYDLLWKPLYKKNEYSSTGLSWSLAKYREFKAVAHAGGDTGFKTNLVILPDQSAAVVVLCNINPSPVLPITYATLDLLLGFEPRPIKAPALIQVGRIMKKDGVKKAVAKWNLLKENHPDQYDFGPGPFFGMIMSVVQSNQIDDARNLASLMFEVMPRGIMQGVEAGLKPYFKGDMDNQASVAFLDVIRTRMK